MLSVALLCFHLVTYKAEDSQLLSLNKLLSIAIFRLIFYLSLSVLNSSLVICFCLSIFQTLPLPLSLDSQLLPLNMLLYSNIQTLPLPPFYVLLCLLIPPYWQFLCLLYLHPHVRFSFTVFRKSPLCILITCTNFLHELSFPHSSTPLSAPLIFTSIPHVCKVCISSWLTPSGFDQSICSSQADHSHCTYSGPWNLMFISQMK